MNADAPEAMNNLSNELYTNKIGQYPLNNIASPWAPVLSNSGHRTFAT